jgi:ribosomal protein L11 methyltransferase
MNSWLEVTLTVSGELAEAVADVLARFAPNGVVTEQAVKYANPEDEGTAIGPITVRAYLPADEKLDVTCQKLEEALFYLGMIRPLPEPVYRPLVDQNWMESWKEHYKPIPIGKKLIIVPVWLESPEVDRIPIRIDPGMAFGTGTHPTTQLCLQLIEKCFESPPQFVGDKPDSVIDIGCGSGILSIGALKLGAGFALGVDIEAASVKASRENADSNGIEAKQFEVGLGSVEQVLAGGFRIRQAPLVLANILAPVIIRLLSSGLADLVRPGGKIILSGILAEQSNAVVQAAESIGMNLVEKYQDGDWVAILCKR